MNHAGWKATHQIHILLLYVMKDFISVLRTSSKPAIVYWIILDTSELFCSAVFRCFWYVQLPIVEILTVITTCAPRLCSEIRSIIIILSICYLCLLISAFYKNILCYVLWFLHFYSFYEKVLLSIWNQYF